MSLIFFRMEETYVEGITVTDLKCYLVLRYAFVEGTDLKYYCWYFATPFLLR